MPETSGNRVSTGSRFARGSRDTRRFRGGGSRGFRDGRGNRRGRGRGSRGLKYAGRPFEKAYSSKSVLAKLERTQHCGVWKLARRQECLVTKSLVKEEASVEEKVFDIAASDRSFAMNREKEPGVHHEYRVWSFSMSVLAQALLRLERLPYLSTGSKVLCLQPGSDTAPLHFSDIVGETGRVYLLESSHKHASIYQRYASRRSNLIPVYAPSVQRALFLLPMVDIIFCSELRSDDHTVADLVHDNKLESLPVGCCASDDFEVIADSCLRTGGLALIVFGCNQTAVFPSAFEIRQRVLLSSNRMMCSAVFGTKLHTHYVVQDTSEIADKIVEHGTDPLPNKTPSSETCHRSEVSSLVDPAYIDSEGDTESLSKYDLTLAIKRKLEDESCEASPSSVMTSSLKNLESTDSGISLSCRKRPKLQSTSEGIVTTQSSTVKDESDLEEGEIVD